MNLKKILTYREQRQIELVEALYYSGQSLDSEQLATDFHATSENLVKYATMINEDASTLTIEKRKSSYLLQSHQTFGIDQFYADLMENTLEMQVLEFLLAETMASGRLAAKKMNMSASKMGRLLKRFRTFFAPYQIKIMTQPLRMEGNEPLIRYLFTLFYKEKRRKDYGLEKDSSLEKTLRRLIEDFFNQNQLERTYYLEELLYLSCRVAITREENGHFLPSNPREAFFKPPKEAIQISLQRLLTVKQIHLDLPDLLWLIAQDYFLLSEAHLNFALAHNPYVAEIYQLSQLYLIEFQNYFDLALSEPLKKRLLYEFCNENFIYHRTSDYLSILGNPRKAFVKQFEKKHPKQIRQLQDFITKYGEKYEINITDDHLHHQMFLILTLIPDFVTRVSPKISTLILSDLAPTHGQFLCTFFSERLAGNLSFELVQTTYSGKNEIYHQLSDYDLIITTFAPLENFGVLPIQTVSPNPSEPEIAKIQTWINEQ